MSGIKQSDRFGQGAARPQGEGRPMTQAVRRALAASRDGVRAQRGQRRDGGEPTGSLAAACGDGPPGGLRGVRAGGGPDHGRHAGPGPMEHVPVELHPTPDQREYRGGRHRHRQRRPHFRETDLKYDVVAISGYSTGGDVSITNQSTGYLYAGSLSGEMRSASTATPWTAASPSTTPATSWRSPAAGSPTASLRRARTWRCPTAASCTWWARRWAAGIEAQGEYSDGRREQRRYHAGSAGGQAFGIYATGAEVTVGNEGDIEASGLLRDGHRGAVHWRRAGDELRRHHRGPLTYYYNPLHLHRLPVRQRAGERDQRDEQMAKARRSG